MAKRVKRQIDSIPVFESSGNVFADMGLPDPEGELAKAQLASRIYQVVSRARLTQIAAARRMGLDQPKVSALMNGRLEGFSAMDHGQRGNQARDLAKFEQVGFLLRAPAELPLNLEIRLEDQDAAGADQLGDLGHPEAIEVVEEQHHVELAEVGPGPLQVGLDPFDREPEALGGIPALANLGGVAVNGHDLGPELGGSQGMPPGAAGKIEDPGTPAHQR